MSEVQIFTFNNQELNALEINGEPWFIAKDVADILEYTDTQTMTRRLEDYEKGVQNLHTLGGNQNLTIINESGLYSAILGSNKPQAKAFKKWVTSEVLPSIRKTGSYGIAESQDYVALLEENNDNLKTILLLNAKIAELKSKPKWSPLSLAERNRIKELKSQGANWAIIARALDRSVSAVKAAVRR